MNELFIRGKLKYHSNLKIGLFKKQLRYFLGGKIGGIGLEGPF
jgi:hypothetical protein